MTDGAGQQATATSAAFGPIAGPPVVTAPPAPLSVEATSPAGATVDSLAKVSSGIDGSYLEATSTAQASTGNTFRDDAPSGQYIFNLSTKGLTSGTWRLRTDFGDGNPDHTVLISLR